MWPAGREDEKIASPSLLECSDTPSGPFPQAGETRGSVVACRMVSGTVRKEKESDAQRNHHLISSCQRVDA